MPLDALTPSESPSTDQMAFGGSTESGGAGLHPAETSGADASPQTQTPVPVRTLLDKVATLHAHFGMAKELPADAVVATATERLGLKLEGASLVERADACIAALDEEMRTRAEEQGQAQQARMAALEKALRDVMRMSTVRSTEPLKAAIAQVQAVSPPAGSSLQAALLEAEASLRNQEEVSTGKAAGKTLGKLESGDLEKNGSVVVAKLESSDVVVAKLESSDVGARRSAVATLAKLEAAEIAQHAAVLVATLEDSDKGVRRRAVTALGKLDAATLTTHAAAVVAKLGHASRDVRRVAVETIIKLEAAELAQHAAVLVATLEDSDKGVRRRAVTALGKLQWAALLSPDDAAAMDACRMQDA